MKEFVLAFMVFNILDLGLTLVMLDLGGSEMNPIMDYAFRQSPLFAVIFKIGLGAIAVLLLMRFRQDWALKVITYSIIGVCLLNSCNLVFGQI